MESIALKRGFQEAFEDVIDDCQQPSKVRLLASTQGDADGFTLSGPAQAIEPDLEDVRSPLLQNREHYKTTLPHTITEPCNCTETRLRLVPCEQSSKRIIILGYYTVGKGRPVRGEIHFNVDDAIAEAPSMKAILVEDRQKKEEALTVLIDLMTDRRTHDDKAIVYLLSQDIVCSQYVEEDIDVSIEYLRSIVLEFLQAHDRMGTLEKDKECALSRDCFEGIWNASGRLEAASARIKSLGIARNKTKQANRNSVATKWTRTVPVLFPLHHLNLSRLDSRENCPFPFALYFTWLALLKESLLQENYGHLIELQDEREAAGKDTSATDDCLILTIMQAMDKQLDAAACTLNRAAEFWRRSKEAKDTDTYTRLLRGHLVELYEMANIFNQVNLVVESATKQGTSQCSKIKARAAEAGRKLRELNRLHQRIVPEQQEQAGSDCTTAEESQAIASRDGLDDHPQALVKRDNAHTVQQKARSMLKEPRAEGAKTNVQIHQLEGEQSQIEAKATADPPVRMPNEEYWVVSFFDLVVFLLLIPVPIFYNIVAVLLIIHLATKLWDLL